MRPDASLLFASGKRPGSIRLLLGLLVLHGVAAVGGGTTFLVDPSGGAAGLEVELLSGTPFTTFLWPGILLAAGLGLPALIAGYAILSRTGRRALPDPAGARLHWSWWLSLCLGVALMAWIVVQVSLLPFTWLQPLMFAVGAAITGLSLLPTVRASLTTAPPPRAEVAHH